MLLIGVLIILIGVALIVSAKAMPADSRGKGAGAGGVMLLIGFLLAISSGVTVVPPGTVGIVKLFGKVSPQPLREGLHVINPLASVEQISIRTQEYTMSGVRGEGAVVGDDAIRTLSRDGLPLPVDVTVNFRAEPTATPWLFRSIGNEEDFVSKIVRPAARAAVRDGVSRFTAQEAYSTKREELVIAITKGLEKYIADTLTKNEDYPGNAFIIQQVLLRNIELPDRLKQSIEAKLTAEQEALRMQYILEKEKQEAERKRIEARGIADFQAIVSLGLTDKLLLWKGIEATQELSKSDNTKVVIIGGGKGGLPVILNADGAVSAAK